MDVIHVGIIQFILLMDCSGQLLYVQRTQKSIWDQGGLVRYAMYIGVIIIILLCGKDNDSDGVVGRVDSLACTLLTLTSAIVRRDDEDM